MDATQTARVRLQAGAPTTINKVGPIYQTNMAGRSVQTIQLHLIIGKTKTGLTKGTITEIERTRTELQTYDYNHWLTMITDAIPSLRGREDYTMISWISYENPPQDHELSGILRSAMVSELLKCNIIRLRIEDAIKLPQL